MIGRTISHYQILEKLGEGGMGVVYKARDTHLNRSVALKVLPPEKVADPERKRRFVQEAQSASALNHPNIIHIYDIDQQDGVDYIAMEHVQGKTLGELIGRKGLKLGETLKYAVQIADALSRAHAAGIIHRDLKPGNIMVDEHGLVKVLDFGLAKLAERGGPDDETATMAVKTDEGTIVGTASYMSPEQAEGKPLDARSDIFSFGAVLYEMVTGQRAFKSDSRMSTLAAVIRQDPAPFPAEVPRDLVKTITRSLRKDPERRFQHMGDVKVALEELKEESDSGKLAVVSPAAIPKRTWRWLSAAVLLACVAGGVWLLWRNRNKPPSAPRVSSLTYFAGSERQPAFSPDGKQVAFVWDGERENNDDIYVMLVGSTTALRLTTDPAQDIAPVWSPDSTQIAFVRKSGDRAAIMLMSALGGPQRKLVDFHPVPQPPTSMEPSLSWSPNAEWLVLSEADSDGGNGLSLVSVDRGEKRRLVSNSLKALRYHYPAFSHDGSILAFAACSGERSCDVYVQDLGRGYLARGQPRRLTDQGATILGIGWAPDGNSLVYAASPDLASPFRLWRVPLSGGSAPELLQWAGEAASYPALPRSGNRLSFSRTLPSQGGIWKLEAGAAPVLFFPSGREGDPRFSPDGKRVAFYANRAGKGSELWVANSDGTNQVRLIESTGRMLGAVKWSPDNRWLVYNAQQADGRWDNYRIDAAGGQPQNLTSHPADETLPSYSRDGRWIYFASNRTGRLEVWRMPSAGGEARQVTDNGGFEALESWNGETLYYTKGWFSPLYARPVAGGPEKLVLESARLAVLSFDVVENGLYYVWWPDAPRPARFEVRFFEPTTGSSKSIASFEAGGNQGLTVSPDRKTILCGFVLRRNDDLMLVENFR